MTCVLGVTLALASGDAVAQSTGATPASDVSSQGTASRAAELKAE
jgi:hypothetical protein